VLWRREKRKSRREGVMFKVIGLVCDGNIGSSGARDLLHRTAAAYNPCRWQRNIWIRRSVWDLSGMESGLVDVVL
jgi:hypothetical protein